jgi:hypothetical protein
VFDRVLLRHAVQELANDRGLAVYEGRVTYTSEPPGHAALIEVPLSRAESLESFVDEVFPNVVDGLYFVKASDWSSESEYRFLLRGDVADYEYVDITAALTAIFVGPRFPTVRLDDLRARSGPLSDGRIYQVHWLNGHAIGVPAATTQARQAPRWSVPPLPERDPDTRAADMFGGISGRMLSALSPMLERAVERYGERATVHTSDLPAAHAVLGEACGERLQARFRTDYGVSVSSPAGLLVSGAILIETQGGDVTLACAHVLVEQQSSRVLWHESRRERVEIWSREGDAMPEELAHALSQSFDAAIDSVS